MILVGLAMAAPTWAPNRPPRWPAEVPLPVGSEASCTRYGSRCKASWPAGKEDWVGAYAEALPGWERRDDKYGNTYFQRGDMTVTTTKNSVEVDRPVPVALPPDWPPGVSVPAACILAAAKESADDLLILGWSCLGMTPEAVEAGFTASLQGWRKGTLLGEPAWRKGDAILVPSVSDFGVTISWIAGENPTELRKEWVKAR